MPSPHPSSVGPDPHRPLPRRRGERRPGDAPVLFFRSFLERPKEIGSVIPSSRFLERRVARAAALDHARLVVELGPGTGGTTRALLRHLAPEAQLLAIEINPRLAAQVRHRLPDPRLVVHTGSAAEIVEALGQHGLGTPDVVVSGIPFSTMPRPLALGILHSVRDALAPGGLFVAYQVRDRVAVLGRTVFGPPRTELEVRNVPPMRVYRFVKGPGGARSA
jgi:phosphatidylethanolamine/phosphatidyl-N-methylethanolamine N-methyltransferase